MPTHRLPTALAPLVCLVAALVAPLGACRPGDPVAEVRELHLAGRYDASLEPLRALVEERPEDPEVQYLYGVALVRTRQLTVAQFALRKAMETREWLVPAGLELAAAELLTDNAEAAIEATDRILEVEPDHLDALLLRARAHATSRRNYDLALADVDRALELDPGNIEALLLRVVSLLGLERVEEAGAAIALLEKTAEEAEFEPAQTARFCAMRAVFTKEKRDFEEAERIFDGCLEATPADFTVTQEAIKFFDGQGRPDRSIEILRAALEAEPSVGIFRRSLAARLRQRGESEEAERILREALELENPGLVLEAWVDLANHYHALENYPEAAEALGQAVALGGAQDPQLVFNHADALVMAERYDEALAVAKGIEFPVHRQLIEGRVALEQGDPALALERFSEALRLWPDNAVLRYYAALAAEGTGDFDRAIAEYRYSIRADADATDARLRLARLHAAEGAADQALAAVRHDFARNPAGIETELVGIRVSARLGRMNDVRGVLARLSSSPEAVGPAVAAAAEGIRERGGAAAAVKFIEEGVQGIDLTQPRNADVLRVLVASLAATEQVTRALEAAESALAAYPESAAFHEIHAAALEASGAPAEEVRAEYERAIELDADQAVALEGLGRLAADAGDPTLALDFYARAAAADPEATSALVAAAEVLGGLGRSEEAEARLEAALRRNPYAGAIASRLVKLRLERDAELDETLALARQATRFGGGPDAYSLLALVHQRRGETELAKQAAARAAAHPGARPSGG